MNETTGSGRFRWLTSWPVHAAVAVGLLALVAWRARFWELNDQYEDFDLKPAIGAVLLTVPVLLLVTLRGMLILQRQGHRVPFLPLMPIAILGNVVGSLTPAAAGDLLRTPFFKDRHHIPYRDGLAAVVYERGFSLFVLGVSTGAAAAWMGLPVPAAVAVTLVCAGTLLVAPPVGAIVLEWLRPWWPAGEEASQGTSFLRRALATVGDSLESLQALLRDGAATAAAALLTLLIFALMAVQTWLVVRALGLSLSPAEAYTALGASMLAGILTFLPLGLGTFDATFAAVVGAAEGGFSAGAAAAVLLRVTVTLPMGIAAFLSYIYLVSIGRRHSPAQLGAAEPADKIVRD
ncbi:MAG: lysylphosphatidylglycerol synthase transmembrane domain-containing protein [Dehalococcoidia bacterium]